MLTSAGVYIVRCYAVPSLIYNRRAQLFPLPSPLSVTVFWLNPFLNRLGDLILSVVFNLATTFSKFRLAGASKLLSRPEGMVTHQGPCMTMTIGFLRWGRSHTGVYGADLV
jgi:hypothetical protein